ncbi:hypothetical protein G4H71_06725 [Rhodococcus triatomae]|uniref:DUF2231 domain-containing protein n=1 Tax=Rhodococcus triatomae TaxID=300028 RepID=A0A1G8B6K3_9NOCA|nr:DUF2231 domain-containing protein [Rhodococcus triatomae]QNG17564.1 hypothetical protein G4H72_01320 [Rhodococcus triatomae]QNG22768.1 hypothetical protein G4H71_06725 [Rhodococcus triatomae]SDH28816.1 hypothetical protein SAMN05444695_101676 [Rhodococcus triatomae]
MTGTLEKAWSAAEEASFLDRPAGRLRTALRRRLEGSAAETILGGRWLGHPLHPVVVAIPIGTWTGAVILDAVADEPAAARTLIATGLASLSVVAPTGWVDWSLRDTRQRRVGLLHAGANGVAAALMAGSWLRRRPPEPPDTAARTLALAALAALGVGGALGGHLTYALGAGVEHRPAVE